MSADSKNQVPVAPIRSGMPNALIVASILLLVLALSGCADGYPNYYIAVDKMLGQSNVELVLSLPIPTKFPASSVAVVSDTVLAVEAHDSVYFVDVHDQGEPDVIGVYNLPYRSQSWFVSIMSMDGYVYATGGDRLAKKLFVIDAREPTSPQEVNRVEHGVRGRGLAAEDGHLYFASALGLGVQIWNANEPSDPSMVSVYYPPQARVGLDRIDPSYRLPPVVATSRQVAAERALGAFSANGDAASCDDWYGGHVNGADVENGLLYLVVGHTSCQNKQEHKNRQMIDEGGLWIVDIAIPAEPVPIGFLPMGNAFFKDVTVDDGYAYVATVTEGLSIVDVSDPVEPVLVGGHDTPTDATSVAVEEKIAYVLDRNTVQIFDVADPTDPVRIGMMADGFYLLRNFAVRSKYIFLIGPNHELPGINFFVLRLIDPEARPEELLWGVSSH